MAKLRSVLRRALMHALPFSAQRALILSKLKAPAPIDVEVVVADTPALLHEAAELTFTEYSKKRFVDRRGVPVRVTPYVLLPTTIVFVARRAGKVIGTMSLVPDSELGLPMESTFPDELAALRNTGRRLAEVGALAVKEGERGQGLAMLIYKAMWLTAKVLGVQDLVIAIHPDAEPMYRAPLLFERITDKVVGYGGLSSEALAAALRLDLDTFPEALRRVFARDKPSQFNPRAYFLEQTHPQIRVPESRAALHAIRTSNIRGALRLASLRPDTLLAMDDSTFDRLRRAMGTVGHPSPTPT